MIQLVIIIVLSVIITNIQIGSYLHNGIIIHAYYVQLRKKGSLNLPGQLRSRDVPDEPPPSL